MVTPRITDYIFEQVLRYRNDPKDVAVDLNHAGATTPSGDTGTWTGNLVQYVIDQGTTDQWHSDEIADAILGAQVRVRETEDGLKIYV